MFILSFLLDKKFYLTLVYLKMTLSTKTDHIISLVLHIYILTIVTLKYNAQFLKHIMVKIKFEL